MPDDQIEHHRAIEYVEIGVSTEEPFTATTLPDGRGFVVQGTCPGCGGRTTMTIPRGIPAGHKGLRHRRTIPQPAEITVYCMCGHVHENRPPEALDRGCGRFWTVPLT